MIIMRKISQNSSRHKQIYHGGFFFLHEVICVCACAGFCVLTDYVQLSFVSVYLSGM